jgi:hypothetical protein
LSGTGACYARPWLKALENERISTLSRRPIRLGDLAKWRPSLGVLIDGWRDVRSPLEGALYTPHGGDSELVLTGRAGLRARPEAWPRSWVEATRAHRPTLVA